MHRVEIDGVVYAVEADVHYPAGACPTCKGIGVVQDKSTPLVEVKRLIDERGTVALDRAEAVVARVAAEVAAIAVKEEAAKEEAAAEAAVALDAKE